MRMGYFSARTGRTKYFVFLLSNVLIQNSPIFKPPVSEFLAVILNLLPYPFISEDVQKSKLLSPDFSLLNKVNVFFV